MESLHNILPEHCLSDLSVPKNLCGVSSEVIEELAIHLLEFVKLEDEYMIPVIGVLVDLPLSDRIFESITELAQSAIRTCVESDFPLLFRILLKTFTENETYQVNLFVSLLDEVCRHNNMITSMIVSSFIRLLFCFSTLRWIIFVNTQR